MIVVEKIPREELASPFVKAVADSARKKIARDELLADGSQPADLWRFTIYPDSSIDFISLVNIRPAVGNRSIEIKNENIQKEIEAIGSPLL